MSGQKVGRRRTRIAIQPVALPQLRQGEDKTDTRTDRALTMLGDTLNQVIELLQRNIDQGNIE